MVDKYIIYHNPRCSKSRQALALVENRKPLVIEYMKHPLTEAELKSVVEKLGIKAEELIRKGEAIYKEQYKDKTISEDQWIKAMIKHPELMERPIVVKGKKALVARPPEKALELL